MDSRSGMETQEFEHVVAEEKKNRIVQGEIATTTKQTAKLDKMTVAIIVTLITGILLFFISQVINIEFKYKTMIRGIDRNRGASGWPTSGFMTALGVEYPGLAGIHFKNKNLPTAIYLIYRDSTFGQSSCFVNNTSEILAAMYMRSIEYNDMSAQDLICSTWGNTSQPIRQEGCVSDCKSSTDVGDMISKGIGTGSLGFFALGAVKATGAVTGIGSIVSIGAGVAISYFQQKSREKAQNASANCGTSSSSSTVSDGRVGIDVGDGSDTFKCSS